MLYNTIFLGEECKSDDEGFRNSDFNHWPTQAVLWTAAHGQKQAF
jgi:hypothetical protein